MSRLVQLCYVTVSPPKQNKVGLSEHGWWCRDTRSFLPLCPFPFTWLGCFRLGKAHAWLEEWELFIFFCAWWEIAWISQKRSNLIV